MEVLKNYPDHTIYEFNTSPKYVYRDAKNLQGKKIIFINDIALTESNINLIKTFTRDEDKIYYKTLESDKSGKQTKLVLELTGDYIVIMTFAKNTPDEELANPFYNLNIAPTEEEGHKIKGKIAEQNIINGLHHEGYNIANEINKCCIQWLIDKEFTVFNPYTLLLNPIELNNRDVDNLLSFVKGVTFFNYTKSRKINLKGKKIAIGSFDDFKEILEIWSKNTEVQKYKLDSIQEEVLKLLPTLTPEEAETEEDILEKALNIDNKVAKKRIVDDKQANNEIKAISMLDLSNELERHKNTIGTATLWDNKQSNKPCLHSLGLIDYYEIDTGTGHPQKMLYRVYNDNENASNSYLTLTQLPYKTSRVVLDTLNQKRTVLISLLTTLNILINKYIGGVLSNYCETYPAITSYNEMVDFIEEFVNEYGEELQFIDLDNITLEDLDYHNSITESEGGTLLDTFYSTSRVVPKTEEVALNKKQSCIDSPKKENGYKCYTKTGKETISENNTTMKPMENSLNTTHTHTKMLKSNVRDMRVIKSLIKTVLENNVEMGTTIVEVVGSDDGELTKHNIRQKVMHKLEHYPNPSDGDDPTTLKFDHAFSQLVDAGLLVEKFTSGRVYCLGDELKSILANEEELYG